MAKSSSSASENAPLLWLTDMFTAAALTSLPRVPVSESTQRGRTVGDLTCSTTDLHQTPSETSSWLRLHPGFPSCTRLSSSDAPVTLAQDCDPDTTPLFCIHPDILRVTRVTSTIHQPLTLGAGRRKTPQLDFGTAGKDREGESLIGLKRLRMSPLQYNMSDWIGKYLDPDSEEERFDELMKKWTVTLLLLLSFLLLLLLLLLSFLLSLPTFSSRSSSSSPPSSTPPVSSSLYPSLRSFATDILEGHGSG